MIVQTFFICDIVDDFIDRQFETSENTIRL